MKFEVGKEYFFIYADGDIMFFKITELEGRYLHCTSFCKISSYRMNCFVKNSMVYKESQELTPLMKALHGL